MIVVLLVVYFFIIIRFVVSLFNFLSDPKLRRVNKQYRVLVSVLIPVRNESQNIIALLQSIRAQDYQDYEVIILDDDSSDATLQLCQDFIRTDSRFRIIQGQELPPGWTGKNFACHQLSQMAKGRYLLFTDAGVRLSAGLINSCVHRMNLKNLGLLSLAVDQQMITFGELTTVPLMHYLLLGLVPLQLVHLFKTPLIAAASGQFMFFNADEYHRRQWHLQVKNKVVEDAAIMRLVKTAGLNGELLLANKLVFNRSYTNYTQAMAGFSRNLLPVFNYNILTLLVYILILLGGPLMVITTLNLTLIVQMFGLIMLSRIMISLSAGQNALKNVLLHPLQLVNLMLIAFLSVQHYLTRTSTWKGRNI